MQITYGSRVTLHFSVQLADGMLVESSFDDQPETFVVGDGSMDDGLELALIGLRPGEHQTLTLMPGQAFGQRDPAEVHNLLRSQFPADMALEVGQIIGFTDDQGEEYPGVILALAGDDVEVDFNHPLSGREIIFEVQILAVKNPPAEDG